MAATSAPQGPNGGGQMTALDVDEARQRFNETKAKVCNAWIVSARMPDPDARFRHGLGGGWIFPIVRDLGESYGWHPPWLKAVSTPQEISEMEVVMEWMAWLRRQPLEGDAALKRIMGWAAGIPMQALASREHCAARTITNRINRSLAKIMLRFLATVAVVDPARDDEPRRRRRITSFTEPPVRSRGAGPGIADAPDSLEPGKVWVGGRFYFRGEPYEPEGDVHHLQGNTISARYG
jgi:hypothetical protein